MSLKPRQMVVAMSINQKGITGVGCDLACTLDLINYAYKILIWQIFWLICNIWKKTFNNFGRRYQIPKANLL